VLTTRSICRGEISHVQSVTIPEIPEHSWYTKSATNRSSGVRTVRALQSDRRTCSKLCARLASTPFDGRPSQVQTTKLDRRQVVLTTRSICRGEISHVQSVTIPEIPELGQHTLRKLPCQYVHSFEYNAGLWQTDTRRHMGYRASIASRGNNGLLVASDQHFRRTTCSIYTFNCVSAACSRTPN